MIVLFGSGGSSGPVSARYWRLLSTGTNYVTGDGQQSWYELEMFEAADASGSDLTTGKTATASSVFSSPTYDAANVIDNNGTTRHAHAAAEPVGSWIQVDFGTAVTVSSVTITAINSGGTYVSRTMKLQSSSNASAWTDVATFSPADSGSKQTFTDLQ